jgi:hypothetical protein
MWLVALSVLLFACGEPSADLRVKRLKGIPSPFIFRMNSFFSSTENEVNFPVWFEDSIVARYGISAITRTFYLITGTSDEDKALREKRTYFFDRKGSIDSMLVEFFFDDQLIGYRSFAWMDFQDETGYRELKRNKNTDISESESESFILASPLSKGINSWCYREGEIRKCFIPRREFYGPLSVDSILHPSSDDMIVLGTAYFPIKKYNVTNKVHERNVQLYDYFSDGKTVRTISRQVYPFEIKRCVLYDKDRTCMGYVDSTFTDKEFLTCTRVGIKKDERGLPFELKKLKGGKGAPYTVIAREEFEYVFYD